ncbi:MAG: dTDP-4-dehydrorhamnose 3,5-epimerase [Pseudonocardiales bacterium]|nr:dTDP-4-dehydrorhamnose 3,5-epimerase [Actinomycetota bacterium]PZS13501.1 MAG: dTDP-4-dehydrorhamnose 3,5-epimerase [Pseudonocardiales bacterium]
MQFRELAIPGVIEFTPRVFPDTRGQFVAPFEQSSFVDATGHRLQLVQSNHSTSRRGVIRGVHFADVPPGQAKYVYCSRGALLDIAIDVRVGSPTFGQWVSVLLDTNAPRALYLPEGIGHAFIALADDTVMTYLCSTGYAPAAEHTVHPLDPALGLPWPADVDPLLSDKDRAAPTLAEATQAAILPKWADCQARYTELRAAAPHSAG